MPSWCGLWPSQTEAKGPVPGHVSEGAASSDCSTATESYRNNLPQEGFGGTLVGSLLLTNPHRLQWGTGFGLIYLENRTASHFLVSRIKRCHPVKSLGRETIFKLGQFVRNTAQQHLKDAHPLKRESRVFC